MELAQETISKILIYLQKKPYEEVYLLINEIINQVQANANTKEEMKKDVDGTD